MSTSSISTGNQKNATASSKENQHIQEKFKKMTQREHVYNIPDTYCGSADMSPNTIFVYNDQKKLMEKKELTFVPAVYKIVDELMVNVYDQWIRTHKNPSNKVKNTKININRETSEFSIENDGEGIEIALHPEHNIYTIELIFGNLLTSTNYKENEERLTGGKNGLGSKICNIFSHNFCVETVDQKRKLKYEQTFENNMQTIRKPIITENYKGPPYTKITMVPDLKRFGMKEWTPAMIKIIEKRAYELAANMPGVNIYYNNALIPIKNLENFMDLFDECRVNGKVVDIPHSRWEIGLSLSDGFQHVSFVNGIATHQGGKHVDMIVSMLSKYVSDHIEKKKKIKVKQSLIRENLFIFVRSQIVNPSFSSQSKDNLTTPMTKFGSKPEFSDKMMEKFLKLGIVERVLALHEFKETKQLQKVEGGKKKLRLYDIPKLDDANEAGGPNSSKCTLILTEGDSAKATAIAGLSVVGRDLYGVFPLKGKMINSRDKSTTLKGREQLSNNDELTNIKRILGLETGKKYKDTSDLRYGKVMIMTDQDVDGSHIKALFMNWMDNWPELMELNFISCLLTPIIKASKGKEVVSFYSIPAFTEWENATENSNKWKVKYYKGLGTSTSKEAKEYFVDLKRVDYFVTDQSREKLDMVFNKDRASDRKEWLLKYNYNRVLDSSQRLVSYENFIDEELIHFSSYDVKRSIGSSIDGLKPSQRKILFSCFKRNLKSELKVAQLTGYVSENSGYHHGEESLNKTIVAMAQNFVGSNNVELLQPVGQFGSRLEGGKDSASPRYIFTYLNPVTDALFPVADRPLLDYLEDDGMKIEPRFYMPILPLALLNGVKGVGTGWSTDIPCFDPKEIASQYIEKIEGSRSEFTNLSPHYNGFTGSIVKLAENKFMTKGIYRISEYNKINILELPIQTWTNDYKAFLDKTLLENESGNDANSSTKKGKKLTSTKTPTAGNISESKLSADSLHGFLKGYKTKCTESTVNYELEVCPFMLKSIMENNTTDDANVDIIEKYFKLTSKISLTNMNLVDENDIIQKFENTSDIMNMFYTYRIDFYQKRKEYQLNDLQHSIDMLSAKIRFLKGIIDNSIVVYKKSKAELVELLESLNFPKFATASSSIASFHYLLSMSIDSLTTDTKKHLEDNFELKNNQLDELKNLTPEMIWAKELRDFQDIYQKSLKEKQSEIQKELKYSSSSSSSKGTKKVAKKVSKK
jgi:DNA topoisomerase II